MNIINEILNLVVVALGIVCLFFNYPFATRRNWQYIIIFYLAIVSVLDIITFIVYKFFHQNSFYLTPLYIINSFIGVGLFAQFSLKDLKFKKINAAIMLFFGIPLLVKMLFFTSYSIYDQWVWLLLQIFGMIVCLCYFYFLFTTFKKKLLNTPLTYINASFIILFFVPILTNFFQYYFLELSEKYFVASLLLLNISAIVSYTLMLKGILLYRKN